MTGPNKAQEFLIKVHLFMVALDAAQAVSLDGQVITDWSIVSPTEMGGCEEVTFNWVRDGVLHQDTLTYQGLASGKWYPTGKFVANNNEGASTVVRFFSLEPLSSSMQSAEGDLASAVDPEEPLLQNLAFAAAVAQERIDVLEETLEKFTLKMEQIHTLNQTGKFLFAGDWTELKELTKIARNILKLRRSN